MGTLRKYDLEFDFGISRALLPEKAPLSTQSPGGKERSSRCARYPVKTWIREGISRPRSTRAIIEPPTARGLPPRSGFGTVSYTHLRAHETPEHLVCRLLLEK